MIDAVVIGAGPNGLAAAIELSRAGLSVEVFEASAEAGGGARSAELTLPGFVHDVCSSVFATAVVSPFFGSIERRIEWLYPRVSLGHAFADGTAAIIALDEARTADSLGVDAAAFTRASSLVRDLWPDLLAPLQFPAHPLSFARFGLAGLHSAIAFARHRFRTERARALFAGCAAHSFLPLSSPLTAAMGLVMTASAASPGWPFARGGAREVTRALVAVAQDLGVTFTTSTKIDDIASLPASRAVVFDTSPRELARIAASRLPPQYRERLARFRYGPAAFKIDWALDAPIPWRARDLADAGVVHVGGSLDEIAASEAAVSAGRMADAPFFLIAQPTLVDASRAPAGKHIAWAYVHVPFAWHGDDDALVDAIEARIEKLAPGFQDAVIARSTMPPAALERYNASYVGGHIIGGVGDWRQMFARPVSAIAPYATPDASIFLCSSSTPPGGGVHGMCGFHAARSVLAHRARHARCKAEVVVSNQRGLVMDFVIAFIGLCLLAAPWVVGYGYGTMWSPPAIWCSVILGAIILLVAGYRALARDRATWEDWVAGVCGVLAVIAPFVFGFTVPAMWTSIILGVIAAVLSGIQLFGTTPGAGTPAPRAT